jgi:hypothetical protein
LRVDGGGGGALVMVAVGDSGVDHRGRNYCRCKNDSNSGFADHGDAPLNGFQED